MTKIPNNPRVLLCNDDGIHAPGLKSLYEIASQISDDIWIVAPENEQSGASHSLSLRHPLRIKKINEKKYSVNGTPTDCVLVALRHILKDQRPHLVLSGVNYGSNLAEDVTYSGTVAAAMEATLFNIPSVAFSLDVNDTLPKWATAEHFGAKIIQILMQYSWPEKVLVNVNFPDLVVKSVAGFRVTYQGQRQIFQDLLQTFDPRGVPYYWVGSPKDDDSEHSDSDLSAIKQGAITITPINLDLTHVDSLQELTTRFRSEAF
ncbi:MAG: 5'/3'-nucleotidase SurE [Alphaproteobacteria bacterium]|nr:5'/3'-nucleotidase SurE [Alphaproteobacteria bacterium]OJV45637.1 MAG: 5'/3'-nucleotidase SurE [Alphaproteobacteria bacterium 43-37]